MDGDMNTAVDGGPCEGGERTPLEPDADSDLDVFLERRFPRKTHTGDTTVIPIEDLLPLVDKGMDEGVGTVVGDLKPKWSGSGRLGGGSTNGCCGCSGGALYIGAKLC